MQPLALSLSLSHTHTHTPRTHTHTHLGHRQHTHTQGKVTDIGPPSGDTVFLVFISHAGVAAVYKKSCDLILRRLYPVRTTTTISPTALDAARDADEERLCVCVCVCANGTEGILDVACSSRLHLCVHTHTHTPTESEGEEEAVGVYI